MGVKTLPFRKDRRTRERQFSNVSLPLAMATEDGARISAQLYDVSSEGLGITVENELAQGTVVILQLLKQSVRFEVAWCQDVGSNSYTCGLTSQDPAVDIERMFNGLVSSQQVG